MKKEKIRLFDKNHFNLLVYFIKFISNTNSLYQCAIQCALQIYFKLVLCKRNFLNIKKSLTNNVWHVTESKKKTSEESIMIRILIYIEYEKNQTELKFLSMDEKKCKEKME
jgi:hypothetical protein